MSPKRWTLLGAGFVVVTLAAVAAWYTQQGPHLPAGGEKEAKADRSPPRRVHRPAGDGPVVFNVDALLDEGSRESWGKVASLYPGLDEDKKRSVIEHIGKVPELDRAVAYVLATVGEDPRPPSAEPLVAETSAMLRSRFGKPEDFDFVRRSMVMQTTDKRRWLLASALADFAKTVGEASPFYPLKGSLEAKLIDMHSQVADPFVKNAIVEDVSALGSRDAALILARGTNVMDEELEGVRQQKAAVDAVMRSAQP